MFILHEAEADDDIIVISEEGIPVSLDRQWLGNRSRRCMQPCPVYAADGPARATWSQPDTDPEITVSGYATWKLEVFGGNWGDKNYCLHGNHP